ncbi:gluconokinase [Methylobacter luteus]|uniref:gluconokinase n=1 Tax=Methylobacter luteus TaxID=415 RepID=UPI000425563B|nr:gluconokinase [Methylobacter luteus]
MNNEFDDRKSPLSDRPGFVLIIAGVSGAGKTTVGRALAERLGWRFIEGDDYHPAANVAKMQRGEPLNDADREPWLLRLRDEIKACLARGERAILTCSALKERYRALLRPDPERVHFVFLTGSYETLHKRLTQRHNHFMGPDLLASQLETLDLPGDGLIVDIDQPVDAIVDAIMVYLGL